MEAPASEYLLEGVLSSSRAGVLCGPWEAQVVWARNARHHCALLSRDGAAFFLKVRGKPLMTGSLSLAGEVAARRAIATSDHRRALEDAVPALRGAAGDDDPDALVFEGIPGAQDLRGKILRGETPPPNLAPSLGTLLAHLHSIPPAEARSVGAREVAPVVPDFRHVRPHDLAHAPRCYRDFLRLMQLDEELSQRLLELRRQWRPRAFVHGDLKLDNVLCSGSRLFLVDWELSGVGDPLCDLGSLLGSYFYTRLELLDRPDGDHGANGMLLDEARRLLEAYGDGRSQRAPWHSRLADAFSWAGVWLLSRTQVVLPLRRCLTGVDLAAIHLAADLLLDSNPCAARASP